MRLDEQVIKHLAERVGEKHDNRKIGLILPGGGMNGIFGGGVAQVIERYDLSQKFDFIYSYSSGSCTAAYLLSEKTELGSSIYWDDLSANKFIRPLMLNKTMNMNYFCDEVVRNRKKLDIEKIRESKTLLKIYATEVGTGNIKIFTNKEDTDLVSVIKGTCSFPGFSKPVEINGEKYCDGGVTKFISIDEAIRDGCTDILIVPTVPENFRMSKIDISHIISRLLCINLSKEFKKVYKHLIKNYNHYLDHLFDRNDPIAGVNVYTIAPDYYLSPMETDAKKLRAFEEHGVQKANEAFAVVTKNS